MAVLMHWDDAHVKTVPLPVHKGSQKPYSIEDTAKEYWMSGDTPATHNYSVALHETLSVTSVSGKPLANALSIFWYRDVSKQYENRCYHYWRSSDHSCAFYGDLLVVKHVGHDLDSVDDVTNLEVPWICDTVIK